MTVSLDPPTSLDLGLQADVASAAAILLVHSPWLRPASAVVARLGSTPVAVAAIVVVGISYAVRRRTVAPGIFLAASYLGVVLTVAATKQLLHRPEPYDSVGDPGRSFPSGHSATAITVWGGIALVLMLNRTRPMQRRMITGLLTVVVVMAVTMVARSAHWISDVLAGLAVGAAWLTIGSAVVEIGHARTRSPVCAAARTSDPRGADMHQESPRRRGRPNR